MSANGLEVFDRTLQITNTWLKEIAESIGEDRKLAWAALGAVLCTLRDRLPLNTSAHLAAELPILVRGFYYDQYQPDRQPTSLKTREQFLDEVEQRLVGHRPIDAEDAVKAVFETLSRHVPAGMCEKVRGSLPDGIRRLWPAGGRDLSGEAEGPEAIV